MRGETKVLLLKKVRTYMARMLSVFGLLEDENVPFESRPPSLEDHLTPVLDLFCSFRDSVRHIWKLVRKGR